MSRLNGKHILLVEDESLIALDLQSELKDEGARVSITPSVAATLIALQALKFDAAVVDHALQDGDGSEICTQLLKRGIPFFTYSGHIQITGPCRDAVHLTKPAAPGEVSNLLCTLLSSSSARPEPIE